MLKVWLSEGGLLFTSIDDDISANKLLWHSLLNSKFLRGDKVVYVAVIKNIKVWNSWADCGMGSSIRKPQNSHKYSTSYSDNNWKEGQLGYLSLIQIWSSHWLSIDEHKIFRTKSLFLLEFQSNGDRQMVLIVYYKSRHVITSLQAITNYFLQHSMRISYYICRAPNISEWCPS